MKRLLLDANCLMEVLYVRKRAAQIVEIVQDPSSKTYVCALTVHLLYHFAEKDKIKFSVIERLLVDQEILALDNRAVRLAQRRYAGKDFEDCLQAACAEIGGCDEILTLDKNFKRFSKTKLSVRVVQ